MSIAIAVVVRPSKIGRLCAILFSLLLLSIAIYIASLGHVPKFIQCALVLLCGVPAWQGYSYSKKLANTSWRIIVDGNGQLRCQEMNDQQYTAQSFEPDSSTAFFENEFASDAHLLTLASGTTLWPRVLFLRLRDSENATTTNVVVLPDALNQDDFRRLSIACKWMINHEQ